MTASLRAAASILFLVTVLCADAQWLNHPSAGLPRTASGAPDIDAAPQRRADGKLDLSGIWQADPGPRGIVGGVGGVLRSPYFLDVTGDIDPKEAPLQPWARGDPRRRRARNSMDHPTVRCQPTACQR